MILSTEQRLRLLDNSNWLRSTLQDVLIPSIGRLEQQVDGLRTAVERLADRLAPDEDA